MNDQSNGQKLFLTRLRRHRITVLISRVLIAQHPCGNLALV